MILYHEDFEPGEGTEHTHEHEHIHTHDGLTHTHTHIHEHDAHQAHEHIDNELHDSANDIKVLTALLPHWIEHNDSHVEGFEQWAAKAREHGLKETAADIEKAVKAMKEANSYLEDAKKNMG